MAYEQADVELLSWPEDSTFAATAVTHQIMGPRGKVGFVRDIICEVTTSLTGPTSVPEIMIGISSGDFTYGRYRLGTALTTGYGTGVHRASDEFIQGNPPRVASDFASHVVLDGGPLTSAGIAGGSYGTVIPKGRIPATGWVVTNVIQGATSSFSRIFLAGINGASPAKDLLVGMNVLIQGVAGSTSVNGLNTITTVDTVGYQYIEVQQTFSSAYTGGGTVNLVHTVTMKSNGAASGAGGGIGRVKIQWLGGESP